MPSPIFSTLALSRFCQSCPLDSELIATQKHLTNLCSCNHQVSQKKSRIRFSHCCFCSFPVMLWCEFLFHSNDPLTFRPRKLVHYASQVFSKEVARSRRNRCPRPDWVPMFVHLEKRAGKALPLPPPSLRGASLPPFTCLLTSQPSQKSANPINNARGFRIFIALGITLLDSLSLLPFLMFIVFWMHIHSIFLRF